MSSWYSGPEFVKKAYKQNATRYGMKKTIALGDRNGIEEKMRRAAEKRNQRALTRRQAAKIKFDEDFPEGYFEGRDGTIHHSLSSVAKGSGMVHAIDYEEEDDDEIFQSIYGDAKEFKAQEQPTEDKQTVEFNGFEFAHCASTYTCPAKHEPALVFGSITPEILNAAQLKSSGAVEQKVQQTTLAMVTSDSDLSQGVISARRTIAKEMAEREATLEKFDERFVHKERGEVRKYISPMQVLHSAPWRMRELPSAVRRERRIKRKDEDLTIQPNLITKLDTHMEVKELDNEDGTKAMAKQSKKARAFVRHKTIRLTQQQIDNLIDQVLVLANKCKLGIELGYKKMNKLRVIRKKKRLFLSVQLKHEVGNFKPHDMKNNSFLEDIAQKFNQKHNENLVFVAENFKPGDSGLVVSDGKIYGARMRGKNQLFIVRGDIRGILCDARANIRKKYRSMRHYSSNTALQFWKGFENEFIADRDTERDHACTSNFSVNQCGAIAGVITQAINPCGRVTCLKCAEHLDSLTRLEYGVAVSPRIERGIEKIKSKFPAFAHVLRMLKLLQYASTTNNTNTSGHEKIFKMVGDIKEAPFSHINRINDGLIRGGELRSEEFSEMTESLLEIARFLKNRTDVIASNDLSRFRNKVSGKAHINVDLMCDNQLDKNGNFLWGTRGYHAKRFLSNFFEAIDPELGYQAYIIRRNPNGARRLAIDRLMVPTNFEKFRQQMEGNQVHNVQISEECVSRKGDRFVYPCCCVTHEDGTADVSGFELPTKHHLVVGNTGDSKFVDLPQNEDLNLYIAKDGFCYINLFFAMLINVREEQAKDFTKKVRDTMIPKLGAWPKLKEVATACHMLTVFFPDTLNAELPRILVDHNQKMLHVLDSYGSADTGFHKLKANTISQLILFSHDSLKSNLREYGVGGRFSAAESPNMCFKWLIKGIYKPQFMLRIIEDEPYLLLMSLISPSVLIALFNSGSLEEAVRYWINRDQSLTQMMNMLAILASKVSVSKSFVTQMQLLQSSAPRFIESTDQKFYVCHSVATVQQVLAQMVRESNMNEPLVDSGFVDTNWQFKQMVEKNYIEDLETAWQELSCAQKFSITMRSRKLHGMYSKFALPDVTKDSQGKLSRFSPSSLGWKKFSLRNQFKNLYDGMRSLVKRMVCKLLCVCISNVRYLIPDVFRFVNVLLVVGALLAIFRTVHMHILEYRELQKVRSEQAERHKWKILMSHYTALRNKLNGSPTESEFVEYVEQFDAPLADWFKKNTSVEFAFQNKTQGVDSLQKVVAMVALLLMVFDSERSDGVYRILNKLKGIMTTIQSEPMKFQSIDDTHEIFEEKNLTIDFELEGVSSVANRMAGNTFEEWWNNQLRNNNIVEHYRTGGQFVEFTRDTAASVALDIAHGSNFEYLVRGAVGSGKSTGLPFHLSQKGRVLMLEPTKPLAENVFRQLKKDPFFVNPSLRMRGTTCIGSTPIDIMTSGYALHYYANNVANLRQLEFVIIDECHVHDANAIAFVCLLREYGFGGKLIKASATPVGREVEFTTQKPVTLLVEEDMSMSAFVRNLGTGANSDVTQHGENILVYVASYNEVDNMSKMLIDKGYRVTKVDGRTMKSGNVEIETKGTAAQRHFIVATNIIENGVTLDIDVVVDFGVKVLPELDIDARLIRYKKVSISYGERIQRLGRVGRHKSGTALRIGETLKGVQQVPAIVATEAAFYCFAYGLPVMTEGVTTSLLANCTNMQARTMLNFELPIFFMAPLVRFDGTMHAAIHKELVPYKLRDSEIVLNRLAVPSASYKNWSTVRELAMHGYRLSLDESVRTPFYARDIPDKLIQVINDAVLNHKKDAGFGPLTAVGAAKMAYTLQTEPHRLQMTVQILEGLIKKELEKEAYFENVTSVSCLSSNTSINDIVRSIRSRYAVNRTKENLGVLQAARAQLLEFKNIGMHLDPRGNISEFGALECMQFQSENDMSKHLKLKGHWNRSLVTSDAIVAGGVLAGGVWMIYTYFKERCSEKFTFQAKNKRQRQKLKFRAARDNKMAREIYGDDECMEHYFGSRYTAKGKKSGTTKGMGAKTRRFINMYGFEPTDYSFARYVDPLTGATLDEGVLTDIRMVQEHFGKIRHDFIARDELDKAAVSYDPKIQAYFVKDVAKKVLKVDLTPHNPFQMGERGVNIAGYPERDRELRQTGKAVEVAYSALPTQNEIDIENTFEGRSTFYGLRDYNPIATCVCKLQNDSDGVVTTLYGIGYGPMIIVNQHLFRLNNGTLKVESHHGEFIVKNTTELKMFPLEGRDIMLLRMPKDFVPFPQKLQFRVTEKGESVCMVGSNFQTRSISSTVSATSVTAPSQSEGFIKHWLTTKDGQCGLPIVAPKDGKIVGLHSLSSTVSTTNMYTTFPEDFTEKYLKNHENLEWVRKWKLNVDKANWGPVNIKDDLPSTLFRIQKDLRPLNDTEWNFQGAQDWMMNQLEGNLKAVAQSDSNLVTKHVVKGKCALFQLYLETHEEAKQYFQPLLGAYQKSKLNKDAYIKDFKKYATPIVIGQVNCDKFEIAQQKVIGMFEEKGFDTCNYITNEQDIFGALNMNAAVGAMYRGKKKDYFQGFTDVDKEQLLRASCERAYFGKFGVWNGSLKAELRPLEKCLANKTRSFTAAPIDTLLSGKVCVDDFNNKFYALHFGLPSSVGMTKFYGGWNKLLDLLPTGWIYCDADGSQFDSSLTPYLINAVLEIRLKFMEDWDIGKQMLENLYTEIVYTPILTPDGTVVKKHKGNNSGQPSTVVDNTIMVILAVYYAVECLDIKEEISEYLRFLVNGDDLLIAVRPDREFILDTFEHSFSQLGLKYTFVERHSDKGSLWFMSHQGRLRDGLYIPKLESERVVSILEWDRAKAPENRLEALCAAMIEAWGNDELLEHVRRFYYWVLEQAPYSELSKTGKAPYISELALESLYKGVTPDAEELERYACLLDGSSDDDEFEEFIFQANDQEIDAGKSGGNKTKEKERASSSGTDGTAHAGASEKDRDVNAGSKGLFPVPRMKSIVSKKRIPTVRGKGIFNLEHFISYEPQQEDLSNARSTQTQFDMWYDGVKDAYGLDDSGMEIILNGLLVYCIENGTSPNLVGNWIMMDGDKQVEFPLAPLFEHAKPTFRQIMAHYSGLAEAYILKRNATKPYMPRWALKRNLQDFSLAQYAFDFYEMTSKTPNRAREAHAQMKAAALHNTKTKLFGLDGNVGGSEEDTERHTIQDVNRNMHNLLGMKM